MEPWIGLIGVAVGALIAGGTAWLTSRSQLRHQEQQERKKLVLDKLQRLYDDVSVIKSSYSRTTVISLTTLVERKPYEESDSKPIPIDELHMLVGFYAPELNSRLELIMEYRTRFAELLVQRIGLESRGRLEIDRFFADLREISLAIEKWCEEMHRGIVELSKRYI